jgi:hypothetical protein
MRGRGSCYRPHVQHNVDQRTLTWTNTCERKLGVQMDCSAKVFGLQDPYIHLSLETHDKGKFKPLGYNEITAFRLMVQKLDCSRIHASFARTAVLQSCSAVQKTSIWFINKRK